MSATYNIMTIGGNDYDVYADVATADAYLEAESWASAWRAETDPDAKARALVTATRTLDKLNWPGSRTDADQMLEWPRTSTGLETSLVPDDNTIPQRVIDAAAALAGQILAGVDISSTPSTASGAVRMERAGSVEIEYFRDFEDSGTRLPLVAWELIAPLLAGASSPGGAVSSGTSTCSDFTNDYLPSGPF